MPPPPSRLPVRRITLPLHCSPFAPRFCSLCHSGSSTFAQELMCAAPCAAAGEVAAPRRRSAAGDGWAGRPSAGCGRPQYACSCATLEEADYQLLAGEVAAGRCAPASHAAGASPGLWLCGQAALEPALYADLAARNCTKRPAPCRSAILPPPPPPPPFLLLSPSTRSTSSQPSASRTQPACASCQCKRTEEPEPQVDAACYR